jgi:hypothetical protein
VSSGAGRRTAAGLLTALAGFGVAACGASAPSPSLVQLRNQASHICAAASTEIRRIRTPASEAGGGAFLKRGVKVLGPELRHLRSLSSIAPSEALDVYRTALSASARELTAVNGAVRALDRNEDPVVTFKSLQHLLGPLESQADDAWTALQMPQCVGA